MLDVALMIFFVVEEAQSAFLSILQSYRSEAVGVISRKVQEASFPCVYPPSYGYH